IKNYQTAQGCNYCFEFHAVSDLIVMILSVRTSRNGFHDSIRYISLTHGVKVMNLVLSAMRLFQNYVRTNNGGNLTVCF
ncbi:MAG: hypothetical protein LBH90_02575, partial [Tannerella sp.]|nr:hypothetical protein [Tannerella sp.]